MHPPWCTSQAHRQARNHAPNSTDRHARARSAGGGRVLWLATGAAALFAGLGSLGACGSDEVPPRALVVGDSITNLTASDLFGDRGPEQQLTVRAIDGATSADMLSEVIREDPTRYDQVIVNLGTNDLMAETPPEETEAIIEELVDHFSSARCLHLTTVNEEIVNEDIPELAERAGELNRRLREVVDRHGQVRLIDWNGELAAARDHGAADGELLADMVHPTEAGQEALRRLYVQALEGCS